MKLRHGKVKRFQNFTWQGVKIQPYKEGTGNFRGVVRQVLAGKTPDEKVRFELRYFELAPGGYTSLERHAHEHVVIVLRGEGYVLIGEEVVRVHPFDLVYTRPFALHRLMNASTTEPFGFLCTVDRERDRPRYPSPEEIQDLLARHPHLAFILTPEKPLP